MNTAIHVESGHGRRSMLRTVCVCLIFFAVAGFPARAQDRPLVSRPLFETTIFTDGDHIVVPVVIGDRTYRFIVDTGSAVTVYDRLLRERLGPAISRVEMVRGGEPIARKDNIDVVRPANVAIGGMPILTSGIVIDLANLRSISGNEIHGVLGMDFLAEYVVGIDPNRARFSLHRSVPEGVGEKLEIEFVDGLPCVTAAVPGFDKERFLIDTGMDGRGSGYLREQLAEPLLARGVAARSRDFSKSIDITGQTSLEGSLILTRLTLGSFEHRFLRFRYVGDSNILGLGMLMRHCIVLDFPNRIAYVQPSKFFHAVDKPDISGIHFRRVGGSAHVDSVDPLSPASRAGIKAGDMILSIGPHDARTTRLYQLRSILCEVGEMIPIVVQRSERQLAFEVKLESLAENRRKLNGAVKGDSSN